MESLWIKQTPPPLVGLGKEMSLKPGGVRAFISRSLPTGFSRDSVISRKSMLESVTRSFINVVLSLQADWAFMNASFRGSVIFLFPLILILTRLSRLAQLGTFSIDFFLFGWWQTTLIFLCLRLPALLPRFLFFFGFVVCVHVFDTPHWVILARVWRGKGWLLCFLSAINRCFE